MRAGWIDKLGDNCLLWLYESANCRRAQQPQKVVRPTAREEPEWYHQDQAERAGTQRTPSSTQQQLQAMQAQHQTQIAELQAAMASLQAKLHSPQPKAGQQ